MRHWKNCGKRRKYWLHIFFLIYTMFCLPFQGKILHFRSHISFHLHVLLTLSQTTNFRLFQLKVFADHNLKFDENGRKFSRRVENIVGKEEFAHYEQFLLFPVFSRDFYCRHIKTKIFWERVKGKDNIDRLERPREHAFSICHNLCSLTVVGGNILMKIQE